MTEAIIAWDAFVAGHPDGSLLQTPAWAKLKADFGWEWELVTVGAPSSIQAGAVMLFRPLPFKLGTIAYIPRGPVIDWTSQAAVPTLFDQLLATAKRHHAWALWIEPEALQGSAAERYLEQFGFRNQGRTVQPPRTICIDISGDEETIQAAMKSKTRYNIRLARRKGVTVREGDLADLDTFYNLILDTGTRDEFGTHSKDYFKRALELFLPEGKLALLIAEAEGESLAALLVFAVGSKAWYITGASSNQQRNKMPTYALQWEAILWAKRKGCTTYDLWGIPDADETVLENEFSERQDGLWGVYRFKRGFGGEVIRYTGLWEKTLNPLYPLAARFYKG